MKYFLKHAIEIKNNSIVTHKEMIDNNLISKGLIFIYNKYENYFDIVSTDTRCFIVKRNFKIEDFDVEEDFLIDLEILKNDVDFKKFMKTSNIDDFVSSLRANKKHFDVNIFKTKYINFKKNLERYSSIIDENTLVKISLEKVFEISIIQDFIKTLKTSKFFEKGLLIFNNEGTFFKKNNFKSKVDYCISDYAPFSDKKEDQFSICFSERSYLNFPTYDVMKGCLYKVDTSKLMYLRCEQEGYDFYVQESL